MKRKSTLVIVTGVLAIVVVIVVVCAQRWVEQKRLEAKFEARRIERAKFGIESDGRNDFVALPLLLPHAIGPARIGESLFYNSHLAQSKRLTCAACHLLNEGGVDSKLHGGVLTRTVMNASFATVFLNDGSLTNLEDVVVQMIERNDRAGGGAIDKVVRKLGADENILARFKMCYKDGLTSTNLVNAIVQYNRTLLSPRTSFDKYWNGATNELSALQKEGMEIFRRKNCISCHDGPTLGGCGVSNGKKISALRGLGSRRVYLSKGSHTDLGAVLTLMPQQEPMEDSERSALTAFLKTL